MTGAMLGITLWYMPGRATTRCKRRFSRRPYREFARRRDSTYVALYMTLRPAGYKMMQEKRA